MSETPATLFPPDRYGRRRTPARHPKLRTLVIVLMTLGVVVAGTLMAHALNQQYGRGRPYDATLERYYDITDRRVVVQFTVVVPEGETAVCAVWARAGHGGEVGREEVLVVPAAGETHPRVTHPLATSERPVTADVQRCWAAR